MGKTAVAIELSESERRELGGLASRRKTAQGLAQRARIILLAAEGLENKDISLRVEAAPNTVGKWRRRFAKCRIDGLYDEPRPGAPRQIGDDEVARRSFARRSRRRRETRRTGACARWRKPQEGALDDSAAMEGGPPPASSHRDIQALPCSFVRREGARHCRAVPVAARARVGSMRR